jgi:CIC family chloride channel protein
LCADSDEDVFLVRLLPSGWSLVRKPDLKTWQEQGTGNQTLGSMLTDDPVPILHPDLPLDTALRYAELWPLIPVVNRAKFKKLEGVISERDILARYRDYGGE